MLKIFEFLRPLPGPPYCTCDPEGISPCDRHRRPPTPDFKIPDINALTQAAFTAMGAVMDDACAFAHTIRGLAWREYHREGCPYGETPAGLSRWIDENPFWLTR